jgi:hypothetical protein
MRYMASQRLPLGFKRLVGHRKQGIRMKVTAVLIVLHDAFAGVLDALGRGKTLIGRHRFQCRAREAAEKRLRCHIRQMSRRANGLAGGSRTRSPKASLAGCADGCLNEKLFTSLPQARALLAAWQWSSRGAAFTSGRLLMSGNVLCHA